ncbi:glycerol-3-phosphate 1-O-acyltransferase PlsY [Texas Phoenix palm phytoplasma]|uniref:Glycerol-3-phosphate acyltransferase n=1 Tax=Texas Phoenix palm phytoplasma TaxID=176709 RepID=A0ABS5BJZ4_9MOLU|nr:glycerol-3-phosphate 1-O-acyltransferase PlsY [Texas Phoenix palm phytoplasma]MBP3059509.1 glycerol-3-phosphate 1-O-acyltransferase PlsY [Texas Phoenix palm phytoplasma]
MNMNNEFLTVILVTIFYLIGSIPFGLLIGKIFKKKDLRFLGSKNIGSSNAARILGFKYAIIVFILDFLKGFLAIFLIKNNFYNILNLDNSIKEKRIFFGIAAIIGHIFSIFNNFKGGKAIATSVGVISGINISIGILGIFTFIIFLLCFGYASLASIIATLIVNIALLNSHFFNHNSIKSFEIFFIWLISIIIFLKHYNNITKILKGTENKFIFFKKKNFKK